MELDGLTLLVAGCFVAALAGILLVLAWTQARGAVGLLMWGSAFLANALASSVLSIGMVMRQPIPVMAGAGGLLLSMILSWMGVRAFFRRQMVSPLMALPAAVWLVSLSVTVTGPAGLRVSVGTALLMMALVLCAACGELWNSREERLTARWGLIGVFALHALFAAAGGIGLALNGNPLDATPSPLDWFGAIHFERMIFLVGGALFMILMARERSEMLSMLASRVDSLTGVANRGGFLARAERMLRRAHADGAPVSLIVFDLDYFKNVNDTYGHATGDRVLKTFAETAAQILRPGDLLGRLGGEEFAAVLPGIGADAACAVADRVRQSFAAACGRPGPGLIVATASAGVAAAAAGADIAHILEDADRALYRAKALGRNRVERADAAARKPSPGPQLVKVA